MTKNFDMALAFPTSEDEPSWGLGAGERLLGLIDLSAIGEEGRGRLERVKCLGGF